MRLIGDGLKVAEASQCRSLSGIKIGLWRERVNVNMANNKNYFLGRLTASLGDPDETSFFKKGSSSAVATHTTLSAPP